MRKKIYLLFVLFICTCPLFGQSSFSLSQTSIEMTRPSSFFVMYSPILITNLTENELPLRWKRVSNGHGQSNEEAPSAWDIALQDPSEFYNPANTIDSADFILEAGENNVSFFILQLFPNSTAGEYTYYYQIFDPANPEDLIRIDVKFIVTEATNVEQVSQLPNIDLFPNPGNFPLSAQNNSQSLVRLYLINREGQVLDNHTIAPNSTGYLGEIDYPSGMYFILAEFKDSSKSWIQKIIVP